MNLEYILSLIFAGKNNSEPVRLQKPKSKTTVTEYINRFVERNFYLFPKIYRRLRIDSTQRHFLHKNLKDIRERQITNFIKQTKLGRMYGNLSDYGRLF